MQVQVVDQTTHPPKCHSFVGLDRQIGSSPPALLKGEKKEKRKKEKFYIYLDVTHTRENTNTNTNTPRHKQHIMPYIFQQTAGLPLQMQANTFELRHSHAM
jgi:hypothetical protein